MQHLFEIDGQQHELWLSREADGYRLHLSNASILATLAGGHVRIDGIDTRVHVAQSGDRLFVHVDGNTHELLYRDPVSRHAAGPGSGAQDVLRAPMPGVVVGVSVEEGQGVKEGDVLLVIESMKLETAIRAPRDGVVETVHCALSKGFERDAPLISLAPLESQS